MKQIENYKLFDPTNIAKGLPVEAPGNYIFLLRPDVLLPTDMILEQPEFTTLNYEGAEICNLWSIYTLPIHEKFQIFKRYFANV